MSSRLERQLAFLIEMDRLKGVLRRTSPRGLDRRENSAEHSWQVVLMALTLEEHAAEPVDIGRVVRMLVLHDAVEIDVGDTFHYDKADQADLHERERAAAERVFGLLPPDQGQEALNLWLEFEAKETPDSRFAAAVDRLSAFLMNHGNEGGTWAEYSLARSQVLEKNQDILIGAPALFEIAEALVGDGVRHGWLKPH